MTITAAGKAIFLSAMERTGKPVCNIFLTDQGEGEAGLNLALIPEAEAKRVIEINGLKIDISEADEAALEEAVFDGEGENLKVTLPRRGCGCGCGCHHHDEGECCCDDDCDCGGDCHCEGEGHCHHEA